MNLGEEIESKGFSYYKIAGELEEEKGGKQPFSTRGRKSEFTAAACLYIASRIMKEPLFLIDFADAINGDVPKIDKLVKILSNDIT